MAAELVRLNVNLIVASVGTQGAMAAKNATETIPIVMIAVRDPVGTGLIASLARPGGNVTGVSGSAGLEWVAKQLELLHMLNANKKSLAINLNVRVNDKPPRIKPSPLLGEHSAEVLKAWLGIDAAEIAAVKAEGAL